MVVELVNRRRSDHCLDAMSVDALISLVDQHLSPEDAAVFREEVDLYNNQLTGPIPEKLCEGLTSLKRVYIYGNQLWRLIPESLREVVKL